MEIISFTYKANCAKAAHYLSSVPENVKYRMNQTIPKLRRETKKVVQQNAPVKRGVYRRSFRLNNYSRTPWEIGFEVYAQPPHYRLTHLLEGRDDIHPSYAHILKQFRWGQGEKTKNGKIGMVEVGRTKRYFHLKPGYYYASEKMIQLCEEAILYAKNKKG